MGAAPQKARFGTGVSFDVAAARFIFTSGGTGDASSIRLESDPGSLAEEYLGMFTLVPNGNQPPLKSNVLVTDVAENAVRGKPSVPAQLTSEPLTINTNRAVSVIEANSEFLVTVNGISGRVKVPAMSYTMEAFAQALQDGINRIEEGGRKVLGVKVAFNPTTKQLEFTTGTTGDESSIQVTGHPDWGLANTEMRFGRTTEWIKLAQNTAAGALQYVKNGKQTEDASDLSTKTEWWPVYLDRGELTFNLTGKPVSPIKPMGFETVFLQGGKGALTFLATSFISYQGQKMFQGFLFRFGNYYVLFPFQ